MALKASVYLVAGLLLSLHEARSLPAHQQQDGQSPSEIESTSVLTQEEDRMAELYSHLTRNELQRPRVCPIAARKQCPTSADPVLCSETIESESTKFLLPPAGECNRKEALAEFLARPVAKCFLLVRLSWF